MPKNGHAYKALNRSVGKAIHRFDMLSDGDRILVGVSGGKDSLTLLWSLYERLPRIPIHYDFLAVYLDPGFKPDFVDSLKTYCQKKAYPLIVEMTDYGLVAHSEKNRENPCFLCSRRRRQRLFELADEFGCNKIAFGHNKDDIIETLFLNMCYSGEISTMSPVQTFFKDRFTVIRPLAFTDEDVIRRFAKEAQFPDFKNSCPSAKISKRQEIKTMLQQLYRGNRKIKGNLFRAMQPLMGNGQQK